MKRLIVLALISAASTAYNQCQTGSFFGLVPTYSCPDPSELFGNPFGGTFQGPGVSGAMFSPVQAGVGTHVVSYTTPPSSPVAGYIATAGLPNSPSNESFTPVFLMDDDLSMPLPIGFNFNFFGVVYDQFLISSNGFITFDLNSFDSGCCSGQNIPDNFEPNNLIALAWNDLDPSSGGTIGYTTIGTAPNRILIVEFNNVPHFGSVDNPVTVQAKLYEANSNIEIHCTQNSSNGSPQTIGVENVSGTCGITAPGMNASFDLSVVNEMILFTQDAGSYYGHQTGLPLAIHTGSFTLLNLANDALSSALPLGFSFDFYGTNYTEVYVSSNGFLTFSNDANAGCCAGGLLPNADNPNNLIAFAWNNLNPALGGSIGYTTIGTAPDRVFVLNFTEIQHHNGSNPVTVQVKLFESSHLIEIHSSQNTSNGTAMTMGLENAAGNQAISPTNRNANTQFSVVNERTIFYPYYTTIQVTEVLSIEDLVAPEPFDPFPMPITSQCSIDFLGEQFASDNCSGFIFGTTDAVFPITESTLVTWTFTDAAGNTATSTQEIIIEDTMAPVASGFVITITSQGSFSDEIIWTFTDGSGNVAASGGPYFDGGQGILEIANANGTNGPYSFFGTTAGQFNDNVFSFTVQCQGATVASGTVNAGQALTVNNIAACNSFTDIVSFCEVTSIASISATDNCAGEVVGVNDAVLPITSATTITWTFDDGNGNVTVIEQNVLIQNMNTAVNVIGQTLKALEDSPGVTYSWVDCDNDFAPMGVTTQTFSPNSNGNYAVLLQVGNCTAMSDCNKVTGVGITEHVQHLFAVYPNPASDYILVETTNIGTIELLDMRGKLVQHSYVSSGANLVSLSNIASGTYTLRMIDANSVQTSRIVISRN